MGPIARAISDEDVRQAAEYFAAIKPIPWVKVIETSTPPKTFVSIAARHRLVVPGGGTEPIGRRIIQIPEDPFRTDQRDPHSPFLAYVPPGSIAKGEALVKTGGSGKTISCGNLPRGRPEGSRGSAQTRRPATGIHRPATHHDAKRNERRQSRRADEESRDQPFRGRHHLDLGLPGIASSALTRRPALLRGRLVRSTSVSGFSLRARVRRHRLRVDDRSLGGGPRQPDFAVRLKADTDVREDQTLEG